VTRTVFKYASEQLRCRIEYQRMIEEIIRACNTSVQPDNRVKPLETSQQGPYLRDGVQSGDLGRGPTLLDPDFGTKSSDMSEAALDEGTLHGDVQHVTCHERWPIGTQRPCGVRQFYAEL
jgi:hypothetical protein